MRQKAQREFMRRKLFLQAREALRRRSPEALLLFQESLQLDTYLEDIETLCQEQVEDLRASPELFRSLRDLFLKAYQVKFESEKYQPMPEGMKSAQRAHGLQAIHKWFAEYPADSPGA
jgi:hypothetical protein